MLITYLHSFRDGPIHFTFDDGPNPHATPFILEILEKHNATASFFMLGSRVEQYPEMARLIAQMGHKIGNHSYSHSHDIGDFIRCEKIIRDVIGRQSDFIRPPFFKFSLLRPDYEILHAIPIMGGDINSKDYMPISSKEVVSNVIEQAKPGSIVVMHDGSEDDKELPSRAQKTIASLQSLLEMKPDSCQIRINFKDGLYKTIEI